VNRFIKCTQEEVANLGAKRHEAFRVTVTPKAVNLVHETEIF